MDQNNNLEKAVALVTQQSNALAESILGFIQTLDVTSSIALEVSADHMQRFMNELIVTKKVPEHRVEFMKSLIVLIRAESQVARQQEEQMAALMDGPLVNRQKKN